MTSKQSFIILASILYSFNKYQTDYACFSALIFMEVVCYCNSTKRYSLRPPEWYSLRPFHFFTLSFLGCPIQFFTFQNLPKIVNGSHHFSTFLSFSHYFYSTIFFLYIKNQWVPPLYPLFFLFSTTLYIFLNLCAQPI